MVNRELAWMAGAYHGSDEVRGPFGKRKSTKCPARRLVRVSGAPPDSVDHRSGAKAARTVVPGKESLEPQAEPSVSPYGIFRAPAASRA